MTEDPVKLYVVVMGILLCVLGFVAFQSHSAAADYREAIEDAPRLARELKEAGSQVQLITNQLSESKMQKGELTLIEEAMTDSGLPRYEIKEDNAVRRPGSKGKEKRFSVQIRQSAGGRALTREQIARFCQTVERYSQGILKTIEIRINRATGPGIPAPGQQEKVVADLWRGTIIFGLRVVD
jgi:hypothetical protein